MCASRYVFASDIAPGRHSTEAALTAKTSRTIARLLGTHHDVDAASNKDDSHDVHYELEHSPASSRQPYTYVAPPHTRTRNSNPESQQLSPLMPENLDTASSARLQPGRANLPAKEPFDSDPRFDESRWENEFLAPLLPVQVVIFVTL